MGSVLALLAGILIAIAIYLMLSGNLLRFLFGLLILSNGINISIFHAGRLTPGTPPLLGPAGSVPDAPMANALPQALLLTAIVIGFGLLAFAIALTIKAFRTFGHLEVDDMRSAESEDDKP